MAPNREPGTSYRPKLLRVLQEKQFERLGGTATIRTDVRVICATHRDLFEMVDHGEYRPDLFYRLSVFPIELPALRERPEDIPRLVRHFAMNYADRMQKPITAIADEFMAALTRYSWPRNVRELQNFIERSVILSTGAWGVSPTTFPALCARLVKASRARSWADLLPALSFTRAVCRPHAGMAPHQRGEGLFPPRLVDS